MTDAERPAPHQALPGAPRRRLAFRIGLAALFVLITLPWSAQAAALAFYSAKCGHLPMVGDDFAADYEYYLPGDGAYWNHAFSIVPFFGPTAYWCTEKESKFGYHRAVNPQI